MKITKDQIRHLIIKRIPLLIENSKGKLKYPFISINASEQVINHLVNGIYDELSKLHQPIVTSSVCCNAKAIKFKTYGYDECVESCYKTFDTKTRKTLSDLYNEYTQRYNGKPKHSFSHFIRVTNSINHHRTYIRPKIEWWSNVL